MLDNVLDVNLSLGLDFANTAWMRASDHPQETLLSYLDLVAWARQVGFISPSESHHLIETAKRHPGNAESVLSQARELREVIFRIFEAQTQGEQPDQADLDRLNGTLSRAMAGAQLVHTHEGYQWIWETDNRSMEGILAPIVRSVGALLTSDMLQRVGMCADDSCGWLFIDTSKNHSRRWCDMGDCGNRAKQRRHYQRKVGSKS